MPVIGAFQCCGKLTRSSKMIKYKKVVDFLEKEIQLPGDNKDRFEAIQGHYTALEQTILEQYVNKKAEKWSFETPLKNCYQFLTKDCQECQRLNVEIWNHDKIDDQTMLLDFEKDELRSYSQAIFTFIHCIYCDEHFLKEDLTNQESYSCIKCQPKIMDRP